MQTNYSVKWHKWTSEETRFLKKHYGIIGDTKLAELFNENFPKPYPWTKKQIEKRRGYLGLKRTKEQEHRLRVLNNGDGRHYKMWDKRNRGKELEVRNWNGRPYIKINGAWQLYYRHLAKAKRGQIVRTYEGQMRIIDRKENQLLNAKMRAQYPEQLQETIKALNQLNKLIYGKENTRFEGHAI